jgi:hypothetical protein
VRTRQQLLVDRKEVDCWPCQRCIRREVSMLACENGMKQGGVRGVQKEAYGEEVDQNRGDGKMLEYPEGIERFDGRTTVDAMSSVWRLMQMDGVQVQCKTNRRMEM